MPYAAWKHGSIRPRLHVSTSWSGSQEQATSLRKRNEESLASDPPILRSSDPPIWSETHEPHVSESEISWTPEQSRTPERCTSQGLRRTSLDIARSRTEMDWVGWRLFQLGRVASRRLWIHSISDKSKRWGSHWVQATKNTLSLHWIQGLSYASQFWRPIGETVAGILRRSVRNRSTTLHDTTSSPQF